MADQLRDLIRDGAYAPGARLVERRSRSDLGTSHIPVREALARLAEEGLVVRRPRRGARVAELSPRMLDEISSVRVVLEQFVCRRVLERWTPARRGRAQPARAPDDVRRRARHDEDRGDLDVRFHETLWQLADHELLLEVAAGLRGRIEGFLRAANAALAPEELRLHALAHVELVEVLASADETAVAESMRRHIELGAERVARAGGIGSLTRALTDASRPATQARRSRARGGWTLTAAPPAPPITRSGGTNG